MEGGAGLLKKRKKKKETRIICLEQSERKRSKKKDFAADSPESRGACGRGRVMTFCSPWNDKKRIIRGFF